MGDVVSFLSLLQHHLLLDLFLPIKNDDDEKNIVGKIQNRSCYQNLSNGSKFQDNCSIMVIIPISLLLESWFWGIIILMLLLIHFPKTHSMVTAQKETT